MKKTEKSFFVQNLAEELKSASSIVLIDYSGLNVKSQQELKKKLREVGAKMIVVKNTLFKLAGESVGFSSGALTDSVLSGPTALVLTEEDPITPLAVLAKFAKEFELPQLKVGVVEGSFQNKDALVTLSKLPGKNALVAQVVGSIAGPLYGLVGTLNTNMQNLVSILKQASEKE